MCVIWWLSPMAWWYAFDMMMITYGMKICMWYDCDEDVWWRMHGCKVSYAWRHEWHVLCYDYIVWCIEWLFDLLPTKWLYSPLRGPTFQIRKMLFPTVTRGTFYGLPSDVEVECMEIDCVTIPGLAFVRVQELVMYDVGLAGGPIIQEFLLVHVRQDGVFRGMLPPPPPDAPGWVWWLHER